MKRERFVSRVPSAESICKAFLRDKKVIFNKKSKDGSGKANLLYSPGDITWGIVYRISTEDILQLDKIEGGYLRFKEEAIAENGDILNVEVYVSIETTDKQVAYDWYKSLVIDGAKENSLPEEYISYLLTLPSKKINGNFS